MTDRTLAPCSPSSVTPDTEEIFALWEARAAMAWELKPLVAEIEKQRNDLMDLVKHMDIHSNYTRCGYAKMDAAQRELFDRISSGPFSWENENMEAPNTKSIHPETKP